MRSYISLSLRRERLLLIGLAACFILSLPFGALLMKLSHETALRGFHGALAFWTLVGLPGMAVLFGASAGVRLRQEPDKGAEEPMPLSPVQRAAAACAAAGTQALLLSLLVAAVACASSESWREMFLSTEVYFKWQGYPYVRLPLWLLAGTEAVLLLWSFLWAYLFGNGVLGGMLGILWGVLPAAAFACALGLRQDFGPLAAVWPLGFVSVGAVLAGPLLCLRELPPRIERMYLGGARGVLIVAMTLLMGPAAAAGHLSSCRARINRSFVHHQFGHAALNVFDWRWMAWPGVQGRKQGGLLLGSIRGDLVLHRPDGSKELLLKGEDFSLADLINHPYQGRIDSAVWDEGGTLWVLSEEDGGHALWRRESRGEMTRHTFFTGDEPFGFVWHGKELGMRAGSSYAPVPPKGGTPQWTKFKDYQSLRAFLKDSPRLDPNDRRVVRRGKVSWRLPGEGWEFSIREVPSGFFISVDLGKDFRAMALCTPDGKTRTLWKNARQHMAALPDGTLWSWRDPRHLFLRTPDGNTRESLAMDRTLSMASVVRVEGDSVWFLGDMLFKADIKTGAIRERWALPRRDMREADYQIHRDGVFLISGAKLWFAGWDGATRSLDTSPSLPGPS